MRIVPSFPNYCICENGDIFSNFRKTPVKRKQQTHYHGYKVISLYRNKKKYFVYVHRLLAEAYIDSFFNGCVVNHIDGDKTNNNINNLECVTQSENMYHAYKTGLFQSKGINCSV